MAYSISASQHDTVRAVRWARGALELLDQRRLPREEKYLRLDHVGQVTEAIFNMVVRGAPAIGIAAAYGVVLAARDAFAESGERWRQAIEEELRRLEQARPTAVNLSWAVSRMRAAFAMIPSGDPEPVLLGQARRIHEQDIGGNHEIGRIGAALIDAGARVLTHCNAGALATGGYGTALGVIRAAYASGGLKAIYAGETRPWLQGARLTAWELIRDRIPVTVIADGAAPLLMKRRLIDWVIVGADRIAANGDVANKIGTYALAVAARAHGVRFMVAAPCTTVDMSTASGEDIPIETRSKDELLSFAGQPTAVAGACAWNPVFDITPADLVDVIVTDRGFIRQPDRARLERLMSGRQRA